MGQRHQVYALVNDRDEKKVVGIHHQWLYGRTALMLLGNALKFHKKSSKHGAFKSIFSDEQQDALGAVYSIDPANGYFHQTHVLKHGETLDPRMGDNNDGITVIDFTGKKPKYCFMSIGSGDGTIMQAKAFEPMSAESYVRLYYPANPKEKDEHFEGNEKLIAKLLKPLAKYEVLTSTEVRAIFPAMFIKALNEVQS